MIRLIIFVFLLWEAPLEGPTPNGYRVYWKACNQSVYYFDVPSTYCRLPMIYPFTDYWVESWIYGYDGEKIYSKPSKSLRGWHMLITRKFNYRWR